MRIYVADSLIISGEAAMQRKSGTANIIKTAENDTYNFAASDRPVLNLLMNSSLFSTTLPMK